MVKVSIIHFDEHGVIKTGILDVSQDTLDLCWMPVRFLGGTCDRYYTCKDRARADCRCHPSKVAEEQLKRIRQTPEDELTPEEQEIRDSLLTCACCGDVIKPSKYSDGPCFGGEDAEPKYITACRNETYEEAPGRFRAVWHRTDPWRGYYELESPDYVRVFDDAILSGHESDTMLKRLYNIVLERFEEEALPAPSPGRPTSS